MKLDAFAPSFPRALVIGFVASAVAVFLSTAPVWAQWSANPMANTGVAVKTSDQVQPKVRPTPDGGCFISWFDNDPSGNPPFGYDVYLQKLDANGVAQWAPGGLRFADLGMSSTQDYGLEVDSAGNALLAFLDDRNPKGITATVMKVNPSGMQLWGTKGLQIGRGAGFKGNPKITATSDGFVVAAWINGNNVMLQRLSTTGARQWGNGISITAPASFTYSLADLHAGDNGTVIVSFVSSQGFAGAKHLLANKLSTAGAIQWGSLHVAVFDGGSLQFGSFPPFVADGSGGAVFAWYGVSPLQSSAQHILASGAEAFAHNGSLGSVDLSHNQVNPGVSYDAATGSTYLFWDEQLPGPFTNEGISAQKFDAAGNRQWGSTGVVVAPFTGNAVINVTSVLTAAGPEVVWSSEPSFGQDSITGAKLDAAGGLICAPFPVSSILSSKSRLDLTLSSNGVTFATWSDGRTDSGDIYVQDVKADCSLGL